jgi:hypothetical protein
VDPNVLQGEVNHNMRQRFGMTRDGENLFVRHRVRVIAKQFPAPSNGDRCWSIYSHFMINILVMNSRRLNGVTV